ncbi:hypothetical protein PSHT_08176, partial [Puccinia striiformis]
NLPLQPPLVEAVPPTPADYLFRTANYHGGTMGEVDAVCLGNTANALVETGLTSLAQEALAKVKNTPKPSKLPKEPTPKLGKTMPKPSETMSNLSTTTLKLGATTNLSPGNWILLYKG